jgi:pullulanase-type alpha-1,6-glucosidase
MRALPLAVLLLAACGGGGYSGGGGGGGGGGGTGPVVLSTARAVWLDAGTIVWPGTSAGYSYRLYYSASAALAPVSTGLSGADNAAGDALAVGTLSAALQSQFPQYAAAPALQVPAATQSQIAALLRDQLAIVQYAGSTPSAGTAVQIGPVLDAVYSAAAAPVALGLSFSGADVPTFRVWAPTAKSVKLNIYSSAAAPISTTFDMAQDAASGVWSYSAPNVGWTNGAYYTYSVNVFSRWAGSGGAMGGALVTNEVTDPYSVSLNANSRYSMVLNLADAIARPAGWPGALIPTAAAPTDSVIYELHLRDFSVSDSTVIPAADQGRYLAFTHAGSAGMQHLALLAAAGLTHVHLLPAFDIASVDEANCTVPAITASTGSGTAAESDVKATQTSDCFNWGYDPLHYGAPEGSYSSNPDDGLARVKEFRQMVQALHATGLRVIMDVVYNHTSASGQDGKSILDRVVPGYYHRLNGSGAVENHSCCADTATERVMMAKLMTDTLLTWADQYKVDGFRFDVMGMIPKSAMIAARTAVEAIAAADGRGHTYFYGEGWDPDPEVSAVIAPATQTALAGTGIGTFNDRLRDGARGGSPFDSGAAMVAHQGFVNGLCYDPAGTAGCTGDASDAAFNLQNRISVGLAGNLASFAGVANVAGVGYTGVPQENIAYVSVHDGETLFDISQYRHPAGTVFADFGRAQVVGLSLAVLAQGVPFIHAGDDLLRSKSGDSNSFNSGDYFNRLYWDGSANNWAVGLPPDNTGNNGANAATLGPILDRPLPSPASQQAIILATSAAFADLLRVRRDTNLFRLTTAADINGCVSFPDQGAQVHGLIVERILGAGSGACPLTSSGTNYRSVVVLFNASKSVQTFAIPAYANKVKGTSAGNIYLHPVQFAGSDTVLTAAGAWDFNANATAGSFTVPARTTGVFVEYN